MDATTYQQLAARTECDQVLSRRRMLGETAVPTLLPVRLNHAVIGMTGEVGELAALVEHWLYYGKNAVSGPDLTAFKEELGDLLWYVALACNALGLSLAEVMEANIRKLRARYPERYDDRLAQERDREKER